jgi:hypothetical protein
VKLTVTHLAKNYLQFIEHKDLLLCSQKPATAFYSEPDESTHIPTPYVSYALILSFHLCLDINIILFTHCMHKHHLKNWYSIKKFLTVNEKKAETQDMTLS